MWQTVVETCNELLGIGREPRELTSLHTCLRAVIVFLAGVAMVRLGNKRFLGKSTPLDVLVAVMLGTVLARTVNGSGPFVPTLVAGFVLVLLHRLLTALAFHFDRMDDLLKGHRRTLVEHGQLQEAVLDKSHIDRADLAESVRLNASGASLDQVETAYLERNGDVSVLKKKPPPRVVEVEVQEGVQRVKVELD